jgi:hypothetical protein
LISLSRVSVLLNNAMYLTLRKDIPVHAMHAYRGRSGIAPHMLNFGARWNGQYWVPTESGGCAYTKVPLDDVFWVPKGNKLELKCIFRKTLQHKYADACYLTRVGYADISDGVTVSSRYNSGLSGMTHEN